MGSIKIRSESAKLLEVSCKDKYGRYKNPPLANPLPGLTGKRKKGNKSAFILDTGQQIELSTNYVIDGGEIRIKGIDDE